MQTEIDHLLKQQNDLLLRKNRLLEQENMQLSQQINSLKTILSTYNDFEKQLQEKINALESIKASQHALISVLQNEISKIEHGSFSQDLQRTFQNNLANQLQTQLTHALRQLNLHTIVENLVQTAISPLQERINTQQRDLEEATSTILHCMASTDIETDLKTQYEQMLTLETMLGDLNILLNSLKK